MANELERIQRRYLSQCNGDWEHTYAVSIVKIDNPGRTLIVQLADTACQKPRFETRAEKRSSTDWIHCAVSEMRFCGSGGALNFEEILGIFLDWVENVETSRSYEIKEFAMTLPIPRQFFSFGH